jgi:hypothetical protein
MDGTLKYGGKAALIRMTFFFEIFYILDGSTPPPSFSDCKSNSYTRMERSHFISERYPCNLILSIQQ